VSFTGISQPMGFIHPGKTVWLDRDRLGFLGRMNECLHCWSVLIYPDPQDWGLMKFVCPSCGTRYMIVTSGITLPIKWL
jgi:hypothetical protein